MTKNQKRKQNENRKFILLACVVCLTCVSLAGALIARYVTRNERQAEMVAADFHFSSNYLKETSESAEYTVSDWGNHGIDIVLYNYETENIALIAEEPIIYEVTLDNDKWEISVTGDDGEAVDGEADGGWKIGDGLNRTSQTLHLQYTGADEPGTVKVTVTTKEPYISTYVAEFTLQGKSAPEYKIEDRDTYCVVTIYANDYDGAMEVQWDAAKFSPDNTNPHMTNTSDWNDSIPEGSTAEYPSGTLTVESYHTYELIFVKKMTDIFEKTGSGKIVEIR